MQGEEAVGGHTELIPCRGAERSRVLPCTRSRKSCKLDFRRQQLQRGTDLRGEAGRGESGRRASGAPGGSSGRWGGKGWSHMGRSKTRRPRAPWAEPELQEPEPGRAASGTLAVWAEHSISRPRRSLPSVRNQGERPALLETGITDCSLISEPLAVGAAPAAPPGPG
ncbi:Hypothetical predicted protein [Marmota monax]|uniref:Uncharacterized protein n=1 Tax=Marmota monax TaxID=9995 RepID=A0A5E4CCH5_MARMO|nr:hypothetical protein GHT09_013154 [Marmota monax]VTJ79538.1 Hypothetical predicted protein [Marmota monax]